MNKQNKEYNPNKKRKILIVFHDMIADMHNDEKLDKILTEFFIRQNQIFLLFLSCNHIPKYQKM